MFGRSHFMQDHHVAGQQGADGALGREDLFGNGFARDQIARGRVGIPRFDDLDRLIQIAMDEVAAAGDRSFEIGFPAGQDAEQRGFAGPVEAEQRDFLAAVDAEGEAVEEDFFAPGLFQVLGGENIVGH
jgi:hypothetical protein